MQGFERSTQFDFSWCAVAPFLFLIQTKDHSFTVANIVSEGQIGVKIPMITLSWLLP